MIAYLTDVEGRWDKVESFANENPYVSLRDGALRLADGVTFVFGGDAVDRGPHARRIVALLLAARREYGERVVLLAGNRDINKLRLWRELHGHPPARTPPEVRAGSRGGLLRWILENTMGAKEAFRHRAAELEAEGQSAGDEDVVQSYLDDLAPGGALRDYLGECRLGHRAGATLFFHGGVTAESFGLVPGRRQRLSDVDAWVEALDEFYSSELSAFARGEDPSALIRYQAPRAGTRWNQRSVVYSRLADELANPLLPGEELIARLRASGVGRLVVGHTPSGDCPAIVRDGDFELVLADSSYGRIEQGSQLFLTDDAASVSGATELDDGRRVAVRFTSERADVASPIGRRDRATAQLVKARLADGDYLLFRALPGHRVQQTAASADDIARRTLVPARD
ncbi:MAG: hypothetical protein M3Y87_06405 [Myxococcota bacterium]|nr:hypothetical protein [Myxococcota bacterium]